ncbi:hypothetical protein [Microbacterium esteraromaticum]|uniref:hypothetical protein n=1 Tax=Microbacterium esteraromaticum TaxID=57043 RepID=UPI001958FCAD|nr:hypothetical protein [Microbacterium esteraromaticum]MBM7465295.1 putative membrane protein YkoI [Microbacterium esteraromaticum]
MDNDEKTPAPSDDRDRRDAAAQAAGTQAESAGAETPTERLDDASAPTAASAAPATDAGRRSRRTRNTLIGVGAGVALLAFGGGAFAIGNAVGDDDDDDRPGMHAPAAPGGDDRGGQPGHAESDDDRGDDRHGDDSAGASAPADAAALRAAAEAAIAHASAEGITSIEIERGGYDIDTRLADGTEQDLFVTPEGTVRERGNDDVDDDDDDPLIDLAQLGDILAAAQAAATDSGAAETAFHSLSTSSSAAVYEVELRTGVRGDAEVELDADLGVVRVDIDD